MKRQTNHIWWTAAAFFAAVATVGMVGCKAEPKDTAPEETAKSTLKEDVPEVSLAVLHPSAFPQEILSNGTLTAKNKVDVKWDVSSTILRVAVKNGDRVKKGQLLAEADAQKLKLALQQANTSKKQAYLEMQDFMIGQGYKLSNMDSAPDEVKKLATVRSGYGQAELACRSAQIALTEAVLRAPISGVVANLNTQSGNKTDGTPFCTLLDNSSMEVTFPVMENEVGTVHRGDAVSLSLFAGGEERTGHVTEINPMVGDNGLVQVKAVVSETPDDWFDGMKVNVKVSKTLPAQLVVPKKAVVMRDNRQVVFTLKDGRAFWNYVTVGLENSGSYTISKGIAEGDSVIVDGNLNLAHLSVVTVRK